MGLRFCTPSEASMILQLPSVEINLKSVLFESPYFEKNRLLILMLWRHLRLCFPMPGRWLPSKKCCIGMFYKLAWQVFLLRTSAIQVNLMALGLASDETVFELSRSRCLSCEHAHSGLCKCLKERKIQVRAWKVAKLWSSERRSQACLDYPESWQSKTKSCIRTLPNWIIN